MMRLVGIGLTALCALFLTMDAGLKLFGAPISISATAELGFPADTTRVLGLVLAVATLLYVVAKTSTLGAILITGYLGGAVAVQLQHGSPLAGQVLFGTYLGVALWLGLWLRLPGLRALIPIAAKAEP